MYWSFLFAFTIAVLVIAFFRLVLFPVTRSKQTDDKKLQTDDSFNGRVSSRSLASASGRSVPSMGHRGLMLYKSSGGGGGPCEEATVRNSDTTFTQDIPSGDEYVLEDYTFQFTDENDVVLATEVRPAMIGETFVVESYCPTEFSYNLNINGVFQEVVTVNVNDDINITLS